MAKSANLYARRLPAAQPVDISSITDVQLNAELEKGYGDITAGRTRSAKSVFDDIRKDYGGNYFH